MVSYSFANGKRIQRKATLDKYQFLFQEDISLNSVCFSRPFREKHSADITIGDFWTWQKEKTVSDIELGLSIVIANTRKGYAVLREEINRGSIQLQEINSLHKDLILHQVEFELNKYSKRERFFEYYTKYGYKRAILKYASILNIFGLKFKYIYKNVKLKILKIGRQCS